MHIVSFNEFFNSFFKNYSLPVQGSITNRKWCFKSILNFYTVVYDKDWIRKNKDEKKKLSGEKFFIY
jgi:hypothetical protein